METITLRIEGMSCMHCSNTVKRVLTSLEGVREAVVDLDRKQASVTFDAEKVSTTDLANAVEDAGYTVI